MPKIKNLTVAIAAMSILFAPVAATAAPLADLRFTSATSDENDLRGGFIIPLIALIAIILGILAFDGSDSPTSP